MDKKTKILVSILVILLLVVSVTGLSTSLLGHVNVAGYLNMTDSTYVLKLADDVRLVIGTQNDVSLEYDTNQLNDTLVLGLPPGGKTLLITDNANIGVNHNFSGGEYVRVRLHSGTAINESHLTNHDEWLDIYHNGTHGIVDVGTGDVRFPDGIRWVELDDPYPTPCSTGLYVTAVNDSNTCTAAVKTTGDNRLDGEYIINQTVNTTSALTLRVDSAEAAPLYIIPTAEPPVDAATGMIYVDTDTCPYYYNGTDWTAFSTACA